MRRSSFLAKTSITAVLLFAILPLASLADVGVTIQGIPTNGKLRKTMKCPPGVLPCDDDCTWTLSFTATIQSAQGIDTTSAEVSGVPEIVSNNPPLQPCSGTPVTVTEVTFSHNFAVDCPGEHNSCSTVHSTIKFSARDCSGKTNSAEASVVLSCYYCSNDMFKTAQGNGSTGVTSSAYDQNVLIQFVVMNLGTAVETIDLSIGNPFGWYVTTPPPVIMLNPGASEEFFLEVTVPAETPAGIVNPITLTAFSSGEEVSASDTVYVEELTSAEEHGPAPRLFHLYQNNPNPFNPTTEIVYDLYSSAHVTLDIFDVSGKRIVSLVDEVQEAGSKVVIWHGADVRGSAVSSGIFFYRLTADGETEVRKMVLLR